MLLPMLLLSSSSFNDSDRYDYYCNDIDTFSQFIASRWAAKEAIYKSLPSTSFVSNNLPRIKFDDIEINKMNGISVKFHGNTKINIEKLFPNLVKFYYSFLINSIFKIFINKKNRQFCFLYPMKKNLQLQMQYRQPQHNNKNIKIKHQFHFDHWIYET